MAGQKDELWRGKSRSASWLTTGILLALALLALAAYRGGTGFDVVRRYLRYGTPERASGEILYTFPVSGKNRFAVLGEQLAILSDTELRLADSTGGTVWTEPVHMTNPAMESGGGRAVAYDVGGTELLVFDAGGVLLTLNNPEEEPFLSARLNREGCLAVTAGAQGRRGTVTVYGPSLETLFRFNSSRRFVSDALVTEDSLRMAAVTLGQEEGVFATELVLYRLDSEEPEAEYAVPEGIAVAAAQKGQLLATVTDTCLSFSRMTGGRASGADSAVRYDYGGDHLRFYSLNGDGFAALLLNRYQSGSVGRLVTVDNQGTELGSLELREEVLSLSAAGKYVAVLYSGRLVVYNQAMQEYAALSGTDNLRQVLVRPDGSVLLIGADSARVYLP